MYSNSPTHIGSNLPCVEAAQVMFGSVPSLSDEQISPPHDCIQGQLAALDKRATGVETALHSLRGLLESEAANSPERLTQILEGYDEAATILTRDIRNSFRDLRSAPRDTRLEISSYLQKMIAYGEESALVMKTALSSVQHDSLELSRLSFRWNPFLDTLLNQARALRFEHARFDECIEKAPIAPKVISRLGWSKFFNHGMAEVREDSDGLSLSITLNRRTWWGRKQEPRRVEVHLAIPPSEANRATDLLSQVVATLEESRFPSLILRSSQFLAQFSEWGTISKLSHLSLRGNLVGTPLEDTALYNVDLRHCSAVFNAPSNSTPLAFQVATEKFTFTDRQVKSAVLRQESDRQVPLTALLHSAPALSGRVSTKGEYCALNFHGGRVLVSTASDTESRIVVQQMVQGEYRTIEDEEYVLVHDTALAYIAELLRRNPPLTIPQVRYPSEGNERLPTPSLFQQFWQKFRRRQVLTAEV